MAIAEGVRRVWEEPPRARMGVRFLGGKTEAAAAAPKVGVDAAEASVDDGTGPPIVTTPPTSSPSLAATASAANEQQHRPCPKPARRYQRRHHGPEHRHGVREAGVDVDVDVAGRVVEDDVVAPSGSRGGRGEVGGGLRGDADGEGEGEEEGEGGEGEGGEKGEGGEGGGVVEMRPWRRRRRGGGEEEVEVEGGGVMVRWRVEGGWGEG